MGIMRLGLCMAVDGALTLLSAGVWLGIANTCMDGTLTEKELRHQHRKEQLREIATIMKAIRCENKNE